MPKTNGLIAASGFTKIAAPILVSEGKKGIALTLHPRPHHHVITRRTGAASKGFYQLGRAHWLRLLRAEVAAIVDGRDQRGVLERAIADGIASLRSRPPTEDGGGSSGGGGGDVLVEPDDVVEWVLALETHPAFVDGLPLRRFSVIPALLGDETTGLVDHDETLDGETVASFVRDLRRNRVSESLEGMKV